MHLSITSYSFKVASLALYSTSLIFSDTDSVTHTHHTHSQFAICTRITGSCITLLCHCFFVPSEIQVYKTEFLISCLHLVLDTTALLFLINNPSLPSEVEHKRH